MSNILENAKDLGQGIYTKAEVDSKVATAESSAIQSNYGFKNYIINGGFDVWQRGTSFSGLTNGTYSADRWVVYDSVGDINYNVIRNAGVFSGGYGATFTFNSGTGHMSIIQFIENVTKFKIGSNVTISFEAYTDSTPYIIGVALQGVKGIWTSATGEVVSNISLTNIKTRYSVTLTVPDWTSLGIDWAHLEDTKLALEFNLGANTNGKNFIIGNVQLEEGSVATPFEQRPIGLELSLCQRYYETGFFSVTAGTIGTGVILATNIVYKNVKRIAPTVAYHSVAYSGCSDIATNFNTTTLTSPRLNVSTGGYAYAFGIYTASSEL